MTDAFVLGGVRTPVGRYGGSLSHIRTDDLLGSRWRRLRAHRCAARQRGGDRGRLREPRARGDGRHRPLGRPGCRFPDSVPAITVNRFCASSLTGAISIAHAIRSDELAIGLAGGVESMSRSGWALMKGDAPFMPRGPVFMLDTMWAGAGGPPNPTLLARRLHRDDEDSAERRRPLRAHARRDRRLRAALHQHAAAARDSGRLAKEIMPVEIPASRRQPARSFEHDESIRDDTTAEKLAALAPQPNTTQMTAGNSSPLNDGASAVVLASWRARRNSASSRWPAWWRGRPVARPADHGDRAGLRDPQGARAGRSRRHRRLGDPRGVRAGAVACCASYRTSWTASRFPTSGSIRTAARSRSAIRSAPSGTSYVLTLATELRLREARYGVIGVCVGSGQGVALVLENPAAS